MTRSSLPPSHLFLALAVVAVWGTNFVVIHAALAHLPPLLFATLRFSFAFLPAAVFLKRPDVPLRELAAYGVLIGLGQFGMLYIAMSGHILPGPIEVGRFGMLYINMSAHISPGLASLVVQTQVFFTIGLSMRLTGERVAPFQWVALALAVAGIGVIASHADRTTTPLGLGLVVIAAASWACGNIIARRAVGVNMLAYVVWASVFSIPPLLILSLLTEGWPAMARGLVQADAGTWAAVLWQSVGNTLFGYAAWGWLLARHPAATITPMAMLVPVFGMGASALLLHEGLPGWKLAAAGLVLAGLALNMLWPQLRARFAAA